MRDDRFVMRPIHRIALLGSLVAAAGLKVWLVAAERVPFNADEAVVALMARHVLQGQRPFFFYGQAYMGSLDAYLIAAGFNWFGEQVWVIRGIQTILYIGTLLTTALLGRSALGSWQVGVLAAWFLAIPTVNMTLYTTSSLGGYGEMLLIGNLILLVGLSIAREFTRGQGKTIGWLWVSLGFLVGLGLWVFGLTLVYSLSVLTFLLWTIWKNGSFHTMRAGLKVLALPVCLLTLGFTVGALPWGIYAAANGFGALLAELTGSAIAGVENTSFLNQVVQHTFNFVLFGGTVIAGLRPPWGVEWLAQPLLPVALAFWLGVMVFTTVQLYRSTNLPLRVEHARLQVAEMNFRKISARGPFTSSLNANPDYETHKEQAINLSESTNGAFLLAGVGLILVVGFITTPFGADPSGRYFIPMAVIMALFAAQAVMRLRDSHGRWAWGLVLIVLGFNLWGTVQAAQRVPPGLTTQFDAQTRIYHRHDFDLIAFLEAEGEMRGYSNYWISYPLAFQSGERLIFVPRLPYHRDLSYTSRDDRYAPYQQLVAAAGKVAYITGDQPALENHIRKGLATLRVDWQEKEIGDYRVFYQLSRVVRPGELGLGGELD